MFGLQNKFSILRFKQLFSDYGILHNSPVAQPSIILNDNVYRASDMVVASVSGTSVNNTVYTVENNAKKQFYLNTISLSVSGNAASAANTCIVTIIRNGTTVTILEMRRQVGVGSESMGLPFPVPIPIDRNTAITAILSSATAVINVGCTITGFYEEIN